MVVLLCELAPPAGVPPSVPGMAPVTDPPVLYGVPPSVPGMPPVIAPPMPVFGVDGLDWFVDRGTFGSDGWRTDPEVPGVDGAVDVVPVVCAIAGAVRRTAAMAASGMDLGKCMANPPCPGAWRRT